NRDDVLRDKYKEIVDVFKEMFDINLDVVDNGGDATELKIRISKEKYFLNLDKCGAGIFENLFMITNLCDAQDRIFFIEEPEQHLHPHAQKILGNFLEVAAKDNQLLLTTHSLIFADPKYFEKIRLVRWDASTKINFVDKDILRPEDIQKLKMELEDYSKRNIFFSRGALLVDGSTELGAFPQFIKKMNFSFEMKGLLIISCDGSNSYPLFSRLSASLKIPCFSIFDKDAFKLKSFGAVFNISKVEWKNIEESSEEKINTEYASRGAYLLPGNFETTLEIDGFKSEHDKYMCRNHGNKRISGTLLAEELVGKCIIPPTFEKALNAAIEYFKKTNTQ
ncbi:MAG: AAA family ATPase, partial [Candidatus Aenigmarchaeota archaeon]|nr:AAA family ATPase [Candidatus Aenigmarchaeota archaeon]